MGLWKKNHKIKYKGPHKKRLGVYYLPFGGYAARVKIPTGIVTIGHYKTVKEAAMAYDKMVVLYYGVFAVLNYPSRKKQYEKEIKENR